MPRKRKTHLTSRKGIRADGRKTTKPERNLPEEGEESIVVPPASEFQDAPSDVPSTSHGEQTIQEDSLPRQIPDEPIPGPSRIPTPPIRVDDAARVEQHVRPDISILNAASNGGEDSSSRQIPDEPMPGPSRIATSPIRLDDAARVHQHVRAASSDGETSDDEETNGPPRKRRTLEDVRKETAPTLDELRLPKTNIPIREPQKNSNEIIVVRPPTPQQVVQEKPQTIEVADDQQEQEAATATAPDDGADPPAEVVIDNRSQLPAVEVPVNRPTPLPVENEQNDDMDYAIVEVAAVPIHPDDQERRDALNNARVQDVQNAQDNQEDLDRRRNGARLMPTYLQGANRVVQVHYLGAFNRICVFCRAKYFTPETTTRGVYNKCCSGGKVELPALTPHPDVLRELFQGQHQLSQRTRQKPISTLIASPNRYHKKTNIQHK